MSFISFTFLILFFMTLLGRFLIGRNKNERSYLVLLLVASLVFYGSFVPSYLGLLFFTTGIDFWAGRSIANCGSQLIRRIYLAGSLVANLGLLAFFKYSNFLIEDLSSLKSLFGIRGPAFHPLELVLPIGISFFTFESMSYTIDIYRGKLKPVDSYWKFLLFVSFFTHLVSGPIVRANELLYQFDRKRRIRASVWFQGFYLMILGFFFKMVVADNIAPYVDPNWAYGATFPSASLPIALAGLFSCQIFADFFGYTNIAIGAAYWLGFKLPRNFNSPYIAGSFREFWSRWHITLSRWIRDYLYIPLGGDRGTRLRVFGTLMTTMVLAGLWHGAAFTFVIWGGIHGAALMVERGLGLEKDNPEQSGIIRILWFLVVQVVILIGWIFFRSANLLQALGFLRNIFQSGFNLRIVEPLAIGFLYALPVLLLHLGTFLGDRGWLRPFSAKEKAILCGLMLYGILTLYGKNNAFIYYQF